MRTVSPVGAQSITIVSQRPLSAQAATRTRLNSSSIPGRIASSSATVSSTPRKVMKRVRYSWIVPQWLSSSRLTSTSTASSRSRMRVGSEPMSMSSASRRLWAESVETTSVRRPSAAVRMAVAADRLVLPTPPLPE